MAQKEPTLGEYAVRPEIASEAAVALLTKVNKRRAEIIEQHVSAEAEEIYQYLQADKFEDFPPSFYPIIEDILANILGDPTFGSEETMGSEMFGATMDLGEIGTDDDIPNEYGATIRETSAQVSVRNMVSLARVMALLCQQYENPTPEANIKKSMYEAIARYCATNRIPQVDEVLRNLDHKTLNELIKLWKQQEVNHQNRVQDEVLEADRLENHIQDGTLPAMALFNTRQVQESIADILNQANPEAADKKRAAIYERHQKATAEKARKFNSFYDFIKGGDCFAERIFRFQEGVIDVNNF